MNRQIFGLALVLVIGTILRLIWPADMEYKQDEAWSFQMTQRVGTVDPFPVVGMPSSTGMPNPGLSIWQFLGLAWLFRLDDPIALAQAIQVINVVGLFAFVLLVFTQVPIDEREVWLWAVALAAVNPLAMIIQRKIWPISTMPPLSLLMVFAWCQRSRRWGAFTWGIVTAILAQLHLSSLIFAVGFFLWAAWFRRAVPVRWGWWLIGSILGGLSAIPWILRVIHPPTEPATTHLAEWFQDYVNAKQQSGTMHWHHLFEMKFFLRWIIEPLGMGWGYLLGSDFANYLRYPIIGGRATYLMAVAQVAAIAAGAVIALRAVIIAIDRWRNRIGERGLDPTRWTTSVIGAGLLAGVVMTLLLLPIHRHYLNGLYPLTFISLAAVALMTRPASSKRWLNGRRSGRVLLGILVVAQAMSSAGFLDFIHRQERPIAGEYGISYRLQVERGRVFPLSMIDVAAAQNLPITVPDAR